MNEAKKFLLLLLLFRVFFSFFFFSFFFFFYKVQNYDKYVIRNNHPYNTDIIYEVFFF